MLDLLKKLKPSKPVAIIGTAFIAVILLIATRPSNEPQVREERAWAVEVIEVEPQAVSPTLELFGQVQSPQDAELSAGIEAVVLEMPVRDGVSVAEGDALLILDDRDARLALQQAAADLREAQAQQRFARIRINRSEQAYIKEQELLAINEQRATRAQELFADGLLSQADQETATENLARQQIAVNQAELTFEENSAKLLELDARIARITAQRDAAQIDLDRTRVTAPFDGVISDLQVSEGDRVRVGDPLMRLQNPDAIEIRAQLPARVARTVNESLQEGAIISATIAADDRELPGTLLRVSGQTSAGSGGVDSFIAINEGMSGLRLGSTVRVLLELPEEKNVITVPAEAIYGNDRLYKLNGDRMLMVDIERVGERALNDGRTQVLVRTPGLARSEKIIVTKLANAADGLLVDPSPSGTQPSSAVAPVADGGLSNTSD